MKKILAEILALEKKLAISYKEYKKEHPKTKKNPSDPLFIEKIHEKIPKYKENKSYHLHEMDTESYDEALEYLKNMFGENADNYRVEYGIIRNQEDKKYWHGIKVKLEGPAKDEEIISRIGKEKEIKRPIIIHPENEHIVEGRHRLTAGIKYNLPVPVWSIFKK